MKKLLEWWKIWTMLSIVVFVMTCWILAHGFWWDPTQSPFSDWRIDKQLGNTLDELEWNYLMTKLDTLGGVPAWAVMAFDLSKCPEWWEAYSNADGRVIKGAWTRYAYVGDRTFSRIYSKWDTGWSPYMYLTINNMPEHAHYMVSKDWDGTQYDGWDWLKYPDVPLAWYSNDGDACDDDSNCNYGLAAARWGTARYWLTSKVWSSTPWQFSIEDPYIVLIYCKKK